MTFVNRLAHANLIAFLAMNYLHSAVQAQSAYVITVTKHITPSTCPASSASSRSTVIVSSTVTVSPGFGSTTTYSSMNSGSPSSSSTSSIASSSSLVSSSSSDTGIGGSSTSSLGVTSSASASTSSVTGSRSSGSSSSSSPPESSPSASQSTSISAPSSSSSVGTTQSSRTTSSASIPSSTDIDGLINAGNPFVIQVNSIGTPPSRNRNRNRKRIGADVLAPNWLMANGNTTIDHSKATTFKLTPDGQLLALDPTSPSGPMLIESTDPSVGWQVFAASSGDSVGSISRTLFSSGDGISWVNQGFTLPFNKARFVRIPEDQADGAVILAVFKEGAVVPGQSVNLNGQLSGTPSIPPVSTIAQTYFSSSTIPSATSTTSSAQSTQTAVSNDGTCGPFSGPDLMDHTCSGSNFGACCNSITRLCGNGDAYCGAHCLHGFGDCSNSTGSSSSSSSNGVLPTPSQLTQSQSFQLPSSSSPSTSSTQQGSSSSLSMSSMVSSSSVSSMISGGSFSSVMSSFANSGTVSSTSSSMMTFPPGVSSSSLSSSQGISSSSSSSSIGASSSSASLTQGVSWSSSSSTHTSISTTSTSPMPTSKRGLVYVPNSLYPEDDQVWIQSGSPVNWYYNYQYQPSTIYNNALEFVPMLWGNYDNTFVQTVLNLKNGGMNIQRILAFNEPDGPFNEGGSQITPQDAAARWISDIEPLRTHGILLGAPAVTGSLRGLQWLQDFYTACAGNCHSDFLPVHFYGNLGGVQWILNTSHALYPNMTIWLTEFADPNVDLVTSQNSFLTTINWLDATLWVERYSYFGSFRSYASNIGYNATMLDQCGNLTDIGDWYLDKQPQGYIPGPHSCPYGPQDIRCGASDGMNYVDPATGKVFLIECYIDHSGGDLPNQGQLTSFTDCIGLCANSSQSCNDLSWANGPCYLKTGVLAPPTQNFNVWGAKLIGTTASSSTTSTSTAPPSSSTSLSSTLTSTTSSVSGTVTQLMQYSAMGCISDYPNRALTYEVIRYSSMDVEYCASQAASGSYEYFLLEFTTECFVGHSFLSGAQTHISSDNPNACTIPCPGNLAESCGGAQVGNLYGTMPITTTVTMSTMSSPSADPPSSTAPSSSSFSSPPSSSSPSSSHSSSSSTAAPTSSSASPSSAPSGTSSASVPPCASGLHIPTPTPVPGMACTAVEGNTFGGVTLQTVSMGLYLTDSSFNVFAEDSGVLSLGSGSTAFVNDNLPDSQFDGMFQPKSVIMPFFIDMGISNNGRDGIWYFQNDTYVAFEWRTSNRFDVLDQYDFVVEYRIAAPDVYVFRYYEVGTYSNMATVGVQDGPTGPAAQFGNAISGITAGMVITCDTRIGSGTCVSS